MTEQHPGATPEPSTDPAPQPPQAATTPSYSYPTEAGPTAAGPTACSAAHRFGWWSTTR